MSTRSDNAAHATTAAMIVAVGVIVLCFPNIYRNPPAPERGPRPPARATRPDSPTEAHARQRLHEIIFDGAVERRTAREDSAGGLGAMLEQHRANRDAHNARVERGQR